MSDGREMFLHLDSCRRQEWSIQFIRSFDKLSVNWLSLFCESYDLQDNYYFKMSAKWNSCI